MKCDKLESYYYYEDRVFTPATHTYRVYHADEVDAAIAELKQKLHDVDNQWNEQCKEIAQLKAKLAVLQSFYDLHGNVDNYIDRLKAENEQLKAKLESVQASAYVDSVDAGMRERSLRRALWLARANRAGCEIDYWRKCYEHVDDYFDVRTGQDLEAKRCEKMIRNWIDVKSKCQAKAKEYK